MTAPPLPQPRPRSQTAPSGKPGRLMMAGPALNEQLDLLDALADTA